MAAIVWDGVGDRIYETGLDRGVLYLADRSGVAWNGLRSVIETPGTRMVTPVHHDGVKFTDTQIPGDFVGTLTALTYPDEFLEYEGDGEYLDGVLFKNQLLKRFHLSYRTLIGNDLEGQQYGFKIHILYNLLAVPQAINHISVNRTPATMDFVWTLTSVPEIVEGFSPVSHVVLDSRKIPAVLWADLQEYLYGGSESNPYLPTPLQLKNFVENWVGITIIDNGDGTWTATGGDQFIHKISPDEFEIVNANATYSDPETFTISTGTDD